MLDFNRIAKICNLKTFLFYTQEQKGDFHCCLKRLQNFCFLLKALLRNEIRIKHKIFQN